MTRVDTNNDKVIYREKAYRIVGAAMEVLNELGPGLLEKPYENALVVFSYAEFRTPSKRVTQSSIRVQQLVSTSPT